MEPAKTLAKPSEEVAPPLLSVRDLSVCYRVRAGILGRESRATVVHRVSFDLERGGTLGLVGESGSGKSTIGRAVLGLIPRSGGTVVFDGRDTARLGGSQTAMFRRSAQIIFQDPGGSLDARLPIWETVSEPLVVHAMANGRKALRDHASEMLRRCGMNDGALDRYPHEFSGGQRQRIAIARALVVRPKLIVCDEPTSALDVSVQAQILNLLTDLQKDLGLAYLFISHDLGVVAHMCHRIAVLREGRIVEIGSRQEVLDHPRENYTRSLLAAASPGVDIPTT